MYAFYSFEEAFERFEEIIFGDSLSPRTLHLYINKKNVRWQKEKPNKTKPLVLFFPEKKINDVYNLKIQLFSRVWSAAYASIKLIIAKLQSVRIQQNKLFLNNVNHFWNRFNRKVNGRTMPNFHANLFESKKIRLAIRSQYQHLHNSFTSRGKNGSNTICAMNLKGGFPKQKLNYLFLMWSVLVSEHVSLS